MSSPTRRRRAVCAALAAIIVSATLNLVIPASPASATSATSATSDDVPDLSRWTGRVTLADRDTLTYPGQRSLVTGGVYDRAGRPIAGITVRLYGKLCARCGYAYRGIARTNAHGAYGIRWTSPAARARVYLKARVVDRGPGVWSNASRTHTVQPWPLHFARNSIAVTGARPDSRALFAGQVLRADGRPSAGRVVRLYTRSNSSVGWSYRSATTSNAHGAFQLSSQNPTAPYQVQIRVDSGLATSSTWRTFAVPFTAWATSLWLISNPTTRPDQPKTIIGVASRADGRGVVGAAVRLYQRSSPSQPWQVAVDRAITDSHGTFRLNYTPALNHSHLVRVVLESKLGYRSVAIEGSTGVAKSAPAVRINANTATNPGQSRSLSGQIIRDGQAASDAEGTYEISTNSGGTWSARVALPVQTDGRFTIDLGAPIRTVKVRIGIAETTIWAPFTLDVTAPVNVGWIEDSTLAAQTVAAVNQWRTTHRLPQFRTGTICTQDNARRFATSQGQTGGCGQDAWGYPTGTDAVTAWAIANDGHTRTLESRLSTRIACTAYTLTDNTGASISCTIM